MQNQNTDMYLVSMYLGIPMICKKFFLLGHWYSYDRESVTHLVKIVYL